MPTALPIVSRRRLIVAGAALALMGGTVATACGTTPPVKDVDALMGQLERARSDAALAGTAAAAASPGTAAAAASPGTAAAAAPLGIAAALTVVATQRNAHAKALAEEITRISGEAPPTPSTTATSTSSTASSTASAGPSAPPPKPLTAADVVAALGQSADGASLLATQQSGYRAGLLGSIAAACTAAASVALVNSGQSS